MAKLGGSNSVRRDKDFEDKDMRLEEPFIDEDDGRDGSPVAGSSDDPDAIDKIDPLRKTRNNLADVFEGVEGEGSVTDLTEKDDGQRW